MRTPPNLESLARLGELRCQAITLPTDPPCKEQATWHIAWRLAPRGHFSLVCDSHMGQVADVYDYVDRHLASIMCDMPGTGWLTGAGPSRCVIAPTAPSPTPTSE
jgi:hypothetical protein